jgi:LuxR family maltose regulon positive regulatory protein
MCPAIPEAILHRTAPLQKLYHALIESSQEYKLSLVCAPAGYGKTTLLVDFTSQSQLPCCWYVLNQVDCDQYNFLRNLVASIRYCFPFFGTTLDRLIEHSAHNERYYGTDEADLDTIIDSFVEAITLEIARPFLLFLTNYHEVNDSRAINRLMNRLIQSLPAICSVVIESRMAPSLEYAFLLAQQQIFALDTSDFQFTAQEIRELAHIQGVATLSDIEIEQLINSFDGWIVGVLLGTRLGNMQFLQTYQHTQETLQSTRLLIDQEKLFEYLVHEVFGRQPELYNFLMEAAILQQMTPAFCASLLDMAMSDTAERLSRLERQGLFVSHYEEMGQIIYLCHPVLRDILCKLLQRQQPQRFLELHQRAAQLFYAAQDYEAAIYHALTLDDPSFAIQLIIERYEQLIAEGGVETVARWIGKLPPSITSSHPLLLLIEAKISTILGDQARSLTLLTQAAQLQQGSDVLADQSMRFRADIAIVRSRALFQSGEYVQSQEELRKILADVPAKELSIHAEANTLLGISANVQGDIIGGIAHLQQALQFRGREKATRHVIDLHSMLASSYSLMGNFALAEHHLSRALALRRHVPDEYERVFLFIRMGLVKQRQGIYEEAEEAFLQALKIAREGIHFRRGEAYTLANLGELYQEQEHYTQSLEVLEDGLRLSRQIQDTYLTRGSLRALATTYMFMGDIPTAQLILTEDENLSNKDRHHVTEDIQLLLARGTILLHTKQYEEAANILQAARESLSAAHLQQDMLRSTLRLAACQFALQNDVEGDAFLQEAAVQITANGNHEQLFRLELKHLPQILTRIKATDQDDAITKLVQWKGQGEYTTPAPSSLPILSKADPHIEIRAFGEPVVFLNDVMVTHWRRAKAMELCFYLLMKRKGVRKEQIIDDLWPEWETVSDQAFRSTVHSLRKIVGEKSVVAHTGCYSLDLAASFGEGVFYDVAVFQAYDEQAKQALLHNDNTQAETCLRAMIDLYHGDYVQTIYSNWCSLQRDTLRRANLDAYGKLAEICFQEERWEESIHFWERMLAVDYCQEEAHYGLMRCYAQMGKRSNALRQYQRYAQILHDELSISPGTGIFSLYQQLMEPGRQSPM